LKMPDGKESTGMTSVTFLKLPEGWRIVHDHSSSWSRVERFFQRVTPGGETRRQDPNDSTRRNGPNDLDSRQA